MSSERFFAGVFLVALLSPPPFLPAETVTLRSGKEFQIMDGRVSVKDTEEIFREAEEMLKGGRLDIAGEYWQLVIDRGNGALVAKAKSARARLPGIEYGSFLLLRSGEVLKGKIQANLRADLLGLEGREELPIWRVEEIVAEYHPGYSFVSKTFYPLTLLEVRFRGSELKSARITGEVEFVVHTADGRVKRGLLGKEYQVLNPDDLVGQLSAMTADRISKVVIYPDIKRAE